MPGEQTTFDWEGVYTKIFEVPYNSFVDIDFCFSDIFFVVSLTYG